MDSISVMLFLGLIIWGVVGVFVGLRTLQTQRISAEENQQRIAFANLGASRFQQVQAFIQEYEPLLSRQDIDPVIFSQVLHRGVELLEQIAEEASISSENLSTNSLANVQNLLAAFQMLQDFCKYEVSQWRERFSDLSESEPIDKQSKSTGEYSSSEKASYVSSEIQLRKAENTVQTARRRIALAT